MYYRNYAGLKIQEGYGMSDNCSDFMWIVQIFNLQNCQKNLYVHITEILCEKIINEKSPQTLFSVYLGEKTKQKNIGNLQYQIIN